MPIGAFLDLLQLLCCWKRITTYIIIIQLSGSQLKPLSVTPISNSGTRNVADHSFYYTYIHAGRFNTSRKNGSTYQSADFSFVCYWRHSCSNFHPFILSGPILQKAANCVTLYKHTHRHKPDTHTHTHTIIFIIFV